MHKNPNRAIGGGVLQSTREATIANRERLSDYIEAADQQRDAPAADPEDYIQPPSPQDDYEGYEAIAQRLERVLNLRIVTAGTELYDIMQDCLTIARGGPSADGTVRARQRRRTDH
ncbi:hypothetical protein GmHk_13G036168 [Glycine max]|nr:hypothetical protein GmHk_13G036168 [Glycine max]